MISGIIRADIQKFEKCFFKKKFTTCEKESPLVVPFMKKLAKRVDTYIRKTENKSKHYLFCGKITRTLAHTRILGCTLTLTPARTLTRTITRTATHAHATSYTHWLVDTYTHSDMHNNTHSNSLMHTYTHMYTDTYTHTDMHNTHTYTRTLTPSIAS